MHTQLPQIFYIIFTAVTAAGVLLQAFVLLGIFLAIRESTKKLHEVTDEVRTHLIPALSSSRRLIDDISPKLKIATSNLVEASHTLRHQANHLNATIDDLLNKTTTQATRVNEMLSGVLNSVDHATSVLQHAVAGPARQVSGVLAGLKTGFDVFFRREKEPQPSAVVEEDIPSAVVEKDFLEEFVVRPKSF
jgi:methyl-accepting chemotaxis protein